MPASLRIDFLSNIAQLTAEMRSGKQELGSFQEQSQRFNRSFESTKAAAARAATERGSFAQNFINPYLRPGELIPKIPDLRPDLALRREARLKDLLPWGNATATELSRDAAEKAAAIRDGGRKIGASLRESLREVTGHAAGVRGLGGIFGKLTGLAGAHPLATMAAVTAGFAISHMRERAAMVRETGRESLMLGQSPEDVSRMRAVGLHGGVSAYFLRSMAENKEAFGRMGLNADRLSQQPLISSVTKVSEALGKISNPAERAEMAFELFGRSGAEVLPVLDNFKDKLAKVAEIDIVRPKEVAQTKAGDLASAGAMRGLNAEGERLGFGQSLRTTFMRALETAVTPYNQQGKLTERYAAENIAADTAGDLQWVKEFKGAIQEVGRASREASEGMKGMLGSLDDQIRDLKQGPGATERQRYKEQAEKEGAGEKVGGMADAMDQYDRRVFERDALGEERADRDRLQQRRQQLNRSTMTPEQRRMEAEGAAKDVRVPQGWFDPEGNRRAYEQVQEIKRQAAREYYRERAQLDGQQLARELRSPGEVYQERVKWLRAAAKDPYSGVTKDMSERGVSRAGEDYRRGLGIKDPLGDYARQMTDLWDALKKKGIDRGQFDARHKELRQGTARDLAGEVREVSPIPAMQRNSAEAYSVIAQAQTNAPQVQLLQGISTKLDASDQKLGILVTQGQGQQRPTDL